MIVVMDDRTRRRLCEARDRLRGTEQPALTIDRVARDAGISPFHFIRLFQATFGETPHQYRIRARLERARLLLSTGNRTVTDVCFAVGFSSLGSFSHLFLRRVGEAPSAYRRRLRPSVRVIGQVPPRLYPGCFSLMYAAWGDESQFSRSAAPPLRAD